MQNHDRLSNKFIIILKLYGKSHAREGVQIVKKPSHVIDGRALIKNIFFSNVGRLSTYGNRECNLYFANKFRHDLINLKKRSKVNIQTLNINTRQ